MRNKLNRKNLNERPAARALIALSLTASLAAFGCTTNKTPGNGEPYRGAPGVGPTTAPTANAYGSSSGSTAVSDPSMLSSSTYIEALPTVKTRASRLPLTPDEAAAVMAGHQLHRGVKVLGPVNPGPPTAAYLAAQPMSNGVVLAGGLGGVASVTGSSVGGAIVGGTAVNGATTGTTLNSTITGTTGTTGLASASTGTIATPATAAVPVSPGAFAAGPSATALGTPGALTATGNTGTFTPSVASAAVPSPTVTSGATVINPGSVATVSRPANTTSVSSPSATAATTSGTTATTAATTISANGTSPSRTVISNASGKVTATKSGTSRNQ